MSFCQVIDLPNLFIIDIGYGYIGSTHNATVWTGTQVYCKLERLLSEGEFVWADSHRGQRPRHMKTICVKHIWSAYEGDICVTLDKGLCRTLKKP
jgi:hypothetical protein